MRSSSRNSLVASGRVGCLRQNTCNPHVLQLRHCKHLDLRRLRLPPLGDSSPDPLGQCYLRRSTCLARRRFACNLRESFFRASTIRLGPRSLRGCWTSHQQ